jgi:hypothetical protein
LKNLSEELVNQVVITVEDIAKVKGYKVYPKRHDVVMVLTALMIVNEAIRRLNSGTK